MNPECLRKGCPMVNVEYSGKVSCDILARIGILGLSKPTKHDISTIIVKIANGKRKTPHIPLDCINGYAKELPINMYYVAQ